MCEYSGRLVAWMDGELPDDEAINVEWHVGRCEACRNAVKAYEEVSRAFLPCYEAGLQVPARRPRHWIPVLIGVAAAMVLGAFLLPRHAESLRLVAPPAVHPPEMAFRPAPAAPLLPKPAARRPQVWMVEQPTVQVALPADELFPPGAIPAGFSFIADVRAQQ
jgi:anti-sigma factor RsiW